MNLEWAKKWMSHYNRGGVEDLVRLYADDVKFEDVTLGDRAAGKAELRQAFISFLIAPGASENSFTVTAYTGNSNGGAAEWTWRAKHAGEFLGAQAAGKETVAKGASVLTFRDGQISSQRDYWDSAAVLRQLGAIK